MQYRSSRGWLRVTLLVLLGLAASTALMLIWIVSNPNSLKPLASALSEQFLDRSLSVQGDVSLDVSLKPRITVRRVEFGNAPWSEVPLMASADYLMIQIDLTALFEQRVHVLDLNVRQARVVLEDRVDGSPNWHFSEEEDDTSGTDADGWSFLIEGLEVSDSVVRATLGELAPMEIVIPSLVESTDAAGNLSFEGHGTLNEDVWLIEGSIGTYQEILRAGRVRLDMDLQVDAAHLTVSGVIGKLEPLSGVDLSLEFRGTDAHLLGELFRMPEVFQSDISLTASIRPQASGHYIALNGHISGFRLGITGTVASLADFEGWEGTADLAGPEAAVFGRALQIPGFPDGPFQVTGGFHWYGGDLDLKDVRIVTDDFQLDLLADFAEFPRRAGARANLQLRGSDISEFRRLLRLPSLPEDVPFELLLSLDAAARAELTSSLVVGSHRLTMNGEIGEYPDYTGTRLATTLQGGDIAELLDLAGTTGPLTGPYQASGMLSVTDDGLAASDLRIDLDPFRFTGAAAMPEPESPMIFSIHGSLEVSSLQDLGPLLELDGLPAEPLALQAELSSTPAGLSVANGRVRFRSVEADFNGGLDSLDPLAGLDIRLQVRGGDLYDLARVRSLPEGNPLPFSLTGRVKGEKSFIELLDIAVESRGGRLELEGPIALNEDLIGTRLRLAGEGPNLAALLPPLSDYHPPEAPWKLEGVVEVPAIRSLNLDDVQISVESVRIRLHGLLNLDEQEKTHLSIEASGDSFTDLGYFGEADMPPIPFSLSTRLDGTRQNIRVTELEANWGDSDLSATGSISLTDRPRLVLDGRSKTMNVADLQKAIFGELEDVDPADDLVRVFPDTPIDLQDLQTFDADVDIQVGKFRGRRLKLEDVHLAFEVEDGSLSLERAAYRDDTGHFEATASLRPENNAASLQLQLTGEDAVVGLFAAPDQPRETLPRYSGVVSVAGTGSTLAELIGNLSGTILVSSDGGRISNALLESYMGDFVSNVLNVLNPFVTSEPYTSVNCMVFNAIIRDGALDLKPGFVMRTDKVNMFVFGKVDLKTERLDLALASQARRGIGVSAASITNPYFKIGGTLASPALQLDPGSAAVAASIATATAGLSIVVRGVWDRMMGQRNPCPKFLNYDRSKTGQ